MRALPPLPRSLDAEVAASGFSQAHDDVLLGEVCAACKREEMQKEDGIEKRGVLQQFEL